MRGALRPAQARLAYIGGFVGQQLQEAGLLPISEPLEPLEDVVQTALHPVGPSPSFRENLRSNLLIAAERKITGLVIEYPRPFREGIVLGLSMGLLATILATLALVFRSRFSQHGR